MFKEKYSGTQSKAFWKAVNSYRGTIDLYQLGCVLQDIESRVLQLLNAPTKNNEARPTVRAKRPVQQRKGETVRECSTCRFNGRGLRSCLKCNDNNSGWRPRTASPVA